MKSKIRRGLREFLTLSILVFFTDGIYMSFIRKYPAFEPPAYPYITFILIFLIGLPIAYFINFIIKAVTLDHSYSNKKLV